MGHLIGNDGQGAWRGLDELVDRIVGNRAAMASLQAAEASMLAEAVELVIDRTAERRAQGRSVDNDLPLREVSAELGAAMRLSDRAVQGRMGDATTLVTFYSATFDALSAGRIDLGHVSAILDAGSAIADDDARVRYEQQVLEAAAHETPTRLRSLARAIATSVDPRSAEERRECARARRTVRIIDLDEGMARVLADVPAVLAYAIYDKLTQGAHAVRKRATSDKPSMDVLRADIFCDLILTGATADSDQDALGAISARVQVTVPVLTALGVGNEPALLAGYGPIDVETALRLAGNATGWDRVMTHPHTGAPLAVDRYHPSAELQRFLTVRDEHCRFPGCSMPVWRCDLDHTVDAARGGATSASNLAHLCRRHHTLKHASDWKVSQIGDGVLKWTSPTGRRYLDRPAVTVRFVPSLAEDPPPF